MVPRRINRIVLAGVVLVAGLGLGTTRSVAGNGDEFFEKRIRPVLVEQCYQCHSLDAENVKGSLRLDSRDALLRGGDTGPAVVPGRPDESLLLRAVSYENPDLQMPPRSRLSSEVVTDLRRWIAEGAIWPGGDTVTGTARDAGRVALDVKRRRQEHWAWQPLQRPPVPAVRNTSWGRSPIDQFILAKLETAGLRPAARASAEVLRRRASYALTGLPPLPDDGDSEENTGVASGLDDALVDSLLGSEHFGERWARHWLDKMRYAETMGHEFDYPIAGAWRYRDYVIRAFNQDVPYDRLAREHIAGDLLPGEPRRAPDGSDEGRLATLQYWMCQQVHSPVDVRLHQSEVIDNQIDVVSKAFLGLTVACARCHDHKFDAISTQDYYAWYGIFGSSRYALRAVDDPAERRQQAQTLGALRDRIRSALADQLSGFLESSEPGEMRVSDGVAWRDGDQRLGGDSWMPDGDAFELDRSAAGQPLVLGTNLTGLVGSGWRHSASLSRRFQGALRSATFAIDADFLHLRLAGEGTRFTVAIEGFTLVRAPIYGSLRQAIGTSEPKWVTVDLSLWRGRRAWLELADLGAPDPASPLASETTSPLGWVAVGEVVLSEHREPPAIVDRTWKGDTEDMVSRWRRDPTSLTGVEIGWLAEVLRRCGAVVPERLLVEWRTVEDQIGSPVLAGVMAEGTGMDEPVFIRGNHRTTGGTVSRRFLEALDAGPDVAAYRHGSGRLALAEAMVDPANPLLDRVMVNWVWSHLFGRGLVASVDNLGVLGEAPSHPELLDWLACEFREQGRSVKRLIRQLVETETWQMSSRQADADPAASAVDPANLLWHRARLRRLEGEAVRDAVLAVAGTLNRDVGGPAVPIHLTPFMDGRGRPGRSGPLDGDGRRSLYLEVRRNFLSPFMLAFDAPQPATTVGRRSVSNVPAQSLALMNDPMVLAQARHWAKRVLGETGGEPAPTVRRLFREAFGRCPTPEETEESLVFLGIGVDGQGARPESGDWGELGHALFNAKEFVFVE